CAGMCVRGGHKHWLHLLEVFPDRYAEAERNEQKLRAELGDVAILRERRAGAARPLTLTELRHRHREHSTSGPGSPFAPRPTPPASTCKRSPTRCTNAATAPSWSTPAATPPPSTPAGGPRTATATRAGRPPPDRAGSTHPAAANRSPTPASCPSDPTATTPG